MESGPHSLKELGAGVREEGGFLRYYPDLGADRLLSSPASTLPCPCWPLLLASACSQSPPVAGMKVSRSWVFLCSPCATPILNVSFSCGGVEGDLTPVAPVTTRMRRDKERQAVGMSSYKDFVSHWSHCVCLGWRVTGGRLVEAVVVSFVQHLWGLAYCSQNQGLRGGTRQEPMRC